jgi:thioredoxin 1
MITVTDTNFEADVLRAELPVLLDIWAPSCKPCAEVDRLLEKLAPEFEGKLLLAEANVSECRSLPTRLGVVFLPTLILFVGGREMGRMLGAPTRSELLGLTELGNRGDKRQRAATCRAGERVRRRHAMFETNEHVREA